MKISLFIILIFFQISLAFGQTSLKEIDLENGSHRVGFNHYLTSDSTRTYKRTGDWNNTSIPRPIPVSIWYPSKDNSKSIKRMTVLNYMEILKEEEEWEHLPSDQILNWFYYSNNAANQSHLKEQTTAYKGLEYKTGKFPVIIYAPSYQASSIENFALCEYLASHGYIIISSPSRGTENRFLEGGTGKDMETQARDIEFLLHQAKRLPSADIGQIAAMGFSFGGLSNVLSQMRNKNIRAIVSLDGSIKYKFDILKNSPFFDIKKADVPFIHLAQKDIPKQVLKDEQIDSTLNYRFEFYDSLVYSKAFSLKFHNLTHSCFSTLGVLFQERDKRQDKSDMEIMQSYKWVSIYTLKFLDAYIGNNAEALSFLANSPIDNGVGKGVISQRNKDAHSKKFTFQDFNILASKQNYENLKVLYDSILKKNPSIKLLEENFNNLGLQMVFNPNTSRQGINIFLLAVEIYPHSANLFDSLAESYLFIGNRGKAIESFRKSLILNPQNQNAVDRLKQLRSE